MGADLGNSLRVVRRLLRDQGEILIDRWSSAAPSRYHTRRDFTTAVDLEIEANLKRELKKHFPDHGLSGEETGDEAGESRRQWLIDPIDGTKYYAGMSSLFSISVGLLHDGDPVLGVVYAAPSRQCFYAVRGEGAFLEDQRLKGPQVGRVSEMIVNVDTPNSHRLSDRERAWFEEKLCLLNRRVYRVRALGVGALAACWAASGALDAYIDLTGYVKPQDLAAGRAIMSESGLRVEYVDCGVGPKKLLAAPPQLWGELLGLLGG